jgi:predicted amidohydrolase
MTTHIPLYSALALQTKCFAINKIDNISDARQRMMDTITRLRGQISNSIAFIGPHTKLVVLPEYFLTGHPFGDTIPGWRDKAALVIDGPEYEALGKIAQDLGIYLSGNAYEQDSNFPELYFQTSFIISPAGDVILRYRRLLSMFGATPHDVLDKYLDIYGKDSLFPVVDTELGRMAAVASEEILYPEITRAMVLNGAEIICHSSSEIGSPNLTPKKTAKLARAYENHCFIVSANSAEIIGGPVPEASTDSSSIIVDYHAHILAESLTGETMVANADLDINSLRAYRSRIGMFNTLSRQRLELFKDIYSREVYPANSMLDDNGNVITPDRKHFLSTQQKAIDNMRDKGII